MNQQKFGPFLNLIEFVLKDLLLELDDKFS